MNTGWERVGWDAAFKSDLSDKRADCHEDRKQFRGGWCRECYYGVRVTLGAGWKTCGSCKGKYLPSVTSHVTKCGICAPLKGR
jgi:hypothetical protein